MMTEADKIRFHQQCAILARAKNAKLIPNVNCKDHFCLAMDLEYANDNGKKLDFEKLFNFDDENFAHDILGISEHINRLYGDDQGKLLDCFEPRCGWVNVK